MMLVSLYQRLNLAFVHLQSGLVKADQTNGWTFVFAGWMKRKKFKRLLIKRKLFSANTRYYL